MKESLQFVQVLLAIFLVILVLIQSKGGGFASGIGSSISFYRSRRGLERIVFIATIVLSVALVANSLILVLLG